MSASSPAREGFALIAVVLALVVLEAAIAAALFVGALEATSARAFADRAHVALAAESALAEALAAWDADAIAALPAGGRLRRPAAGAAVAPLVADARIERLGTGGFLVTGQGSALAGADTIATATAVALIGWHDPSAFGVDAPAAVVAGGAVTLDPSARVDGRAASPSGCPPVDSLAAATFPATAGILAPAVAQAPGSQVHGVPPSATRLPVPAATSFGPHAVSDLAAMADRTESGAVTLAPAVAAGTCDVAAPGNWGAPGPAAHPCADYVPLVHVPGDLAIAGGAGQALLVVGGDLAVAAGAAIDGVVLVLGSATVAGVVRGLIRVEGAVRVSGNIQRDPCAVWRAITRPAALARPVRSPRWRLPSS